jgi:hypothetical protein
MDEFRETPSSGRLSPSRIKSARPGPRDIWLSDDHGMRGMGRLLLRITPKGARRFYFRLSIKGHRKTIPLGPYSHVSMADHLTLDQARAQARQIAAIWLAGSPTATAPFASLVGTTAGLKHVDQSSSGIASNALSLIELCRRYIDALRVQGKVSANSVSSEIELYVAGSELANRPAHSIASDEIARLLRPVVEAGNPIARTWWCSGPSLRPVRVHQAKAKGAAEVGEVLGQYRRAQSATCTMSCNQASRAQMRFAPR